MADTEAVPFSVIPDAIPMQTLFWALFNNEEKATLKYLSGITIFKHGVHVRDF